MAKLVLPAPDPNPIAHLGKVLVAIGEADEAELRAMLDRCPPGLIEPVERALAVVAGAGWRAHPAAMAQHFDPGYQRWGYVDLLSLNFARAFRGEDPHQIWNLPSQYGKTTGLTKGIVWALDQDPTLRIMYVSYDSIRAVEVGIAARDLALDHADELRFQLRADRRAAGMWRTTEGGGLYCVGVNGAITGFPADALLLDDLIKGWQAAHSEPQRARVMNVYRAQIRMRVQSETNPIILAGTRWHEDDPSGQLVRMAEAEPEADTFTMTRLPAVAEAADPKNDDPLLRQADPLGRKPGAVLEPLRFSEQEVRARRATLGPYLAAAMEQQRPAPEEGGEVKRAWWRWNDVPPVRFDASLTSWDMKLKDKETGDFVVGGAWGRTGPDFWCVDMLRGQWNFPTTVVAIALMASRHPKIKRHVVENTGNGPEVMAELRRPKRGYSISPEVIGTLGIAESELAAVERILRNGLSGIVPENVKGSKTVRMRAHTGLIEAGNVHLLERPWATALVNEHAAFPGGTHDDIVDMTSQALKKLSNTEASATATRTKTTKPKPGARAVRKQIARPTSRRAPRIMR